ncbi:conserved hypothetical protein [Gloeothece citriformis PCC 7424]|uniref:Uncharacterized protein n=1 Tax=Gloeothece citriformis (strain PCC 7424) TaxID=65393 RepID=B7K8Y4_GLOC7|nr:Gldg family protein [Gloeothece citriformis]ACK72753.1 conserved hypothetical protein [Gloeothece citriformis PCC 7424]
MKLKKLLKYLFIPGLTLIAAGITIRLSDANLLTLGTGLLVAGGVILIIWLGFLLISAQGFWGKRSTQVGTNAAISTLSVIAILGIINFLAVRYSTKIDLTENKIYTLSPQSQEIVKSLKEPVKLWLFDNAPSSLDKELLENYRRYNSNFEYEYVNPDQNPGLVRQVGAKSLGDVYLQYRDKKQLVQTLIAFGNKELLSEIKLTNSIEKILRDRTLTVYFLQGHGEHPLDSVEGGLSEAVASLRDKGYKVEPLNLVQRSEIPKDADVIVIAGPKQDLFPQEVETLKNYAAQGGSLFILLDPTVNAGLTPLLEQWGVKLDERIVIDGSGAGQLVGLGPATPLITNYGNHPITKDFQNEMSFYPLARPIDTLEKKGVEATALLLANEQMWAESDLTSDQIAFDETQDISGPFEIGVALTRAFTPAATTPKTDTPKPSPSPTSPEKQPTTEVKPSPSPTSPEKQPTTEVKPSPSPISVQEKSPIEIKPSPSAEEKQQTKQTQKQTEPTPIPDLQIPQTPAPASSPPSNLIDPEQEILDPTSPNSPTPSPSVNREPQKEQQKQVNPSPASSPTPTPKPSPTVSPSPTPKASPQQKQETEVKPSPTPTPTPPKESQPEKEIEARMVVIGNSVFATNGAFEQQLNGDVFLNSVQWLASGDEQPLSIRPREPENRRIVLSKVQASSIFWLSIVVFPLLGFLLAGITWWRRR